MWLTTSGLGERAVLGAMRNNVTAGHSVTLQHRWRNAFVLAVIVLPSRVQIPASAAYIAPTGSAQE